MAECQRGERLWAFALTVLDIPGAFHIISSCFKDEPKIIQAFRTGEGVGWHEHDANLFFGTERFFRPNYQNNLLSSWIPALDDMGQKLAAGAAVAYVGCGHGASTILLAKAFPKSRFRGFDYHSGSIEHARHVAGRDGLLDQVNFKVASSKSYPANGGYDLVAFFDCLHDMGDPIGAARHVLSTLKPDGTWMIVEPFANDRPEENYNSIGRIYYSATTVICTPASLAQEVGAALGAQAGEERIRGVVTAAGFTRFRRAAETSHKKGTCSHGQRTGPSPLPLEPFIHRHLVPTRQAVGLIRHPHHRHQFAEHGVRHARFARGRCVRRNAVPALIGHAHRHVQHLLGQRVQRARRHDLLDALPGSPQRRRVMRQRFPEIVDPVDLARCHDVVVDCPHLRAGVLVFDHADSIARFPQLDQGPMRSGDLFRRAEATAGRLQPVLVIQADSFNRSRIQTAIVAVITSNLELASVPGTVLMPVRSTGLSRDAVVNVSQLLTLDRSYLAEHAGTLPPRLQVSIDEGLRAVLQLQVFAAGSHHSDG